MTLKKKYESEDDIPTYARGLYVENDGVFVPRDGVDVDGLTQGLSSRPDNKLDEFRQNNRDLRSQLEQLKSQYGQLQKQFEGVDPEALHEYQEQIAAAKEEEERELLKKGHIDEVLRRRTERILGEKNQEVQQRTKAYEDLKAKHESLAAQMAQLKAVTEIDGLIDRRGLRIRPAAREDLAMRIREDWTVGEDGKLVPRRNDLVDEDGSPIKPDTYVERELLDRRSFLFEPARGGGAPGSEETGTGGPKRIANDPLTFGKNLDAIAEGKARVDRG